MKKLFFTLAVLGVCTFWYSCTDDGKTEAQSTLTPPSESAFKGLRSNFLASITKTRTFKAEEGLNYTSDKGVKLTIPANCLQKSDGTTVTGDVDLTYTELFDVGSMVIANKPLLGRDYSGTVGPLVTGGEFFIDAKQGNEKLKGCSGYYDVQLEVPADLTDAELDSSAGEYMSLFTQEDDDDTVWEIGGKEGGIEGGRQGTSVNNTYYCWFPFGWTNIDWLSSLPGEKTELRVKVPTGFNEKNCAVYAGYFGMPNMLALFDVYVNEGEGSPYFTEHYGIAPIGFKLHIIFISYDEASEKVIYAFKPNYEVQKDTYIVFEQSELKTANVSALIDLINNLVK
ncbi:MAG: hypothetical protein LBR48_06390 [Dysgonamonadaceae bacterium]|nr:hypothetical protein [Dysgonamonadaceae bacterium]